MVEIVITGWEEFPIERKPARRWFELAFTVPALGLSHKVGGFIEDGGSEEATKQECIGAAKEWAAAKALGAR